MRVKNKYILQSNKQTRKNNTTQKNINMQRRLLQRTVTRHSPFQLLHGQANLAQQRLFSLPSKPRNDVPDNYSKK